MSLASYALWYCGIAVKEGMCLNRLFYKPLHMHAPIPHKQWGKWEMWGYLPTGALECIRKVFKSSSI